MERDEIIKRKRELRGADLRRANLYRANLREADLRLADLLGADLRGANLPGANLPWADLRGADLRGANLYEANLRGANLRGANLYEANLRGANLRGAHLPPFQIPQEGALIVWGKKGSYLVKMRIPPTARRTASLIGRKCRAEFAEVISVDGDANKSTGFVKALGVSITTNYIAGELVFPDEYDDDPRVECAHGIHFFLTREEALAW